VNAVVAPPTSTVIVFAVGPASGLPDMEKVTT
jgi:hypothetical protein